MRLRISATTALTLVIAATASLAAGETSRATPGVGDPDFLPYNAARMYPLHPEAVWNEVLAVLNDLGLKTQGLDAENGFVKTRVYRFGTKNRPESPKLSGRARPQKFMLHVTVPQVTRPARVYIDTMATASDRIYYGFETPAAWVFEHLETRFGVSGRPMPRTLAGRRILALELLGEDGSWHCLETEAVSEEPVTLTREITSPARIKPSYVMPVYPMSLRNRGEQGRVILQVVMTEDGTTRDPEVLKLEGSKVFAESAKGVARMWKYRPAMSGTCPVEAYFTLRIDFTLSR
jgi:TonB family protein